MMLHGGFTPESCCWRAAESVPVGSAQKGWFPCSYAHEVSVKMPPKTVLCFDGLSIVVNTSSLCGRWFLKDFALFLKLLRSKGSHNVACLELKAVLCGWRGSPWRTPCVHVLAHLCMCLSGVEMAWDPWLRVDLWPVEGGTSWSLGCSPPD